MHAKYRALQALDRFGHFALRVGRVRMPLWQYKICCAVEAEHDRIWPDHCTCCVRFEQK